MPMHPAHDRAVGQPGERRLVPAVPGALGPRRRVAEPRDDPDRARLRARILGQGAPRAHPRAPRQRPGEHLRRQPGCRPRRSSARAGASASSWSGRSPTSCSSRPSSAPTAAPRSVLGAIFFLPLIFGSLSYPARSVAICGVISVLAYAVAALLAGDAQADAIGVLSALLVTAAVMGVSQATNRERQRRELARLSRSDPLDRMPEPARLHRALRGGAVRPRAPRRPPARPDRDRPRQLQVRQRHPGPRRGRRAAVPRRRRTRRRPAPLRRARPARRRRVRGAAPGDGPRGAAGRRRADRPSARARQRRLAGARVPARGRRDRRGAAPQRRRGPLPRQAAPRTSRRPSRRRAPAR